MNRTSSILFSSEFHVGYRYGFNGQEKDDELYGTSGTSYSAEFWQYDSRLGRRWNTDPKPHPSISMYSCFSSNPIMFADPFGDTVKYGGLGDRVHSFFGRIFNKQFRENFREWDKFEAAYTITRSKEFGSEKLVTANPCHINCLNEGDNNEYDQYAVYYNKGFRVNDISNPYVRISVGILRAPFEITWKIGIKLPLGLFGLPYVGIRKLFNPDLEIGWGIGDNLQLPWDPGNTSRGWLSYGLGDYNEWNAFGMRQNKISIGPNDALLGLRVGGGKGMPIQFIDFGQTIRFSKNQMLGYHFRINIWRKGMRGKGMGNAKKDANIDFR